MTSLFDFDSYREYLASWIENQGTARYGLKGRMAAAMGVSSSLVSQVLKGEKTITPDQASELAEFIGLTEYETDFFHLLVDVDRASSHRFREKLQRKVKAMREQSRRIGKRVPRQRELTDEQKAIFYSSWLFTGIFNLTAIPGQDHAAAIAEQLRIEISTVNRILRFLIEQGLCVERDGRLAIGPTSIHVDKESPFVNKHHQNWRVQAIQKMERKSEADVFFTSPMSLSKAAAEEVRRLLPTFIESVMKITGPSPSEMVACLNIDWFEY